MPPSHLIAPPFVVAASGLAPRVLTDEAESLNKQDKGLLGKRRVQKLGAGKGRGVAGHATSSPTRKYPKRTQ
jgi:hypothetical protein